MFAERISLLWCLVLVFSGCGNAPDPAVLATVQDQAVTEAAFRHWWDTSPPARDSAEARQALLDRLVQRQALVQRAKSSGLDEDPVVMEAVESILIARLKEKELQSDIAAVEVSDDEVRAFYERHKQERFTLPERVRLAVLWFDTRGQDLLVQRYRPRLEEARAVLLADPAPVPTAEGFGAHSVRNTEHRASRYRGGDVGWLKTGAAYDPWRDTLLELAETLTEPGQLSPVVSGPEGIFLVRLIDREPARIRAFDEVRDTIAQRLKAERQAAVKEDFHAAARDAVAVHTFGGRLTALEGLSVAPSGPAPKSAQVAFGAQP